MTTLARKLNDAIRALPDTVDRTPWYAVADELRALEAQVNLSSESVRRLIGYIDRLDHEVDVVRGYEKHYPDCPP